MVWPLAGMRPIVRIIAYMLPTTFAVDSITSVVIRGVGPLHENVWPGIVVMIGWTIFFWIAAILIFIRKQK